MSLSLTRRYFVASLATSSSIPDGVLSKNMERTPVAIDLLRAPTGPTIGEPDAIVNMHIYNDFQSHYGRDFYFDVVPFILEDFVQAGKVALIFHDFPRLGTDPVIADPDNFMVEMSDPRNESSLAAQAAMSAGEQGKYLHMCDRLFGSYQEVQSGVFLRKNLNRMALAIQLDMDLFKESMDNGRNIEALVTSVSNAFDSGIKANPMFILDNGNGDPNVIQNTSEGYTLIKKQIELAVKTAS